MPSTSTATASLQTEPSTAAGQAVRLSRQNLGVEERAPFVETFVKPRSFREEQQADMMTSEKYISWEAKRRHLEAISKRFPEGSDKRIMSNVVLCFHSLLCPVMCTEKIFIKLEKEELQGQLECLARLESEEPNKRDKQALSDAGFEAAMHEDLWLHAYDACNFDLSLSAMLFMSMGFVAGLLRVIQIATVHRQDSNMLSSSMAALQQQQQQQQPLAPPSTASTPAPDAAVTPHAAFAVPLTANAATVQGAAFAQQTALGPGSPLAEQLAMAGRVRSRSPGMDKLKYSLRFLGEEEGMQADPHQLLCMLDAEQQQQHHHHHHQQAMQQQQQQQQQLTSPAVVHTHTAPQPNTTAAPTSQAAPPASAVPPAAAMEDPDMLHILSLPEAALPPAELCAVDGQAGVPSEPWQQQQQQQQFSLLELAHKVEALKERVYRLAARAKPWTVKDGCQGVREKQRRLKARIEEVCNAALLSGPCDPSTCEAVGLLLQKLAELEQHSSLLMQHAAHAMLMAPDPATEQQQQEHPVMPHPAPHTAFAAPTTPLQLATVSTPTPQLLPPSYPPTPMTPAAQFSTTAAGPLITPPPSPMQAMQQQPQQAQTPVPAPLAAAFDSAAASPSVHNPPPPTPTQLRAMQQQQHQQQQAQTPVPASAPFFHPSSPAACTGTAALPPTPTPMQQQAIIQQQQQQQQQLTSLTGSTAKQSLSTPLFHLTQLASDLEDRVRYFFGCDAGTLEHWVRLTQQICRCIEAASVDGPAAAPAFPFDPTPPEKQEQERHKHAPGANGVFHGRVEPVMSKLVGQLLYMANQLAQSACSDAEVLHWCAQKLQAVAWRPHVPPLPPSPPAQQPMPCPLPPLVAARCPSHTAVGTATPTQPHASCLPQQPQQQPRRPRQPRPSTTRVPPGAGVQKKKGSKGGTGKEKKSGKTGRPYSSKSRSEELGRYDDREVLSKAAIKLLKGRSTTDTSVAYQEKKDSLTKRPVSEETWRYEYLLKPWRFKQQEEQQQEERRCRGAAKPWLDGKTTWVGGMLGSTPWTRGGLEQDKKKKLRELWGLWEAGVSNAEQAALQDELQGVVEEAAEGLYHAYDAGALPEQREERCRAPRPRVSQARPRRPNQQQQQQQQQQQAPSLHPQATDDESEEEQQEQRPKRNKRQRR